MNSTSSAKITAWLSDPLDRAVAHSIGNLAQLDDVRQIAVLPDVHLAHDVCVGVAVATQSRLIPAAVGNDLGCGMAAIRFDGQAAALADIETAARLFAALQQSVPVMRHSRATMPMKLPAELLDTPLSDDRLERFKSRDGRVQLGTLGRGNHFLELQCDDAGDLWLMLHSGSRGMGQAIAAHHAAQCSSSDAKELPSLEAESSQGQAYLHDLAWAIRYAELNRLRMIAAAARDVELVLGYALDNDSLIHCHHNHVRRECHGGQSLWVHRKGALSAQADEPGIIPGSMGTASFHVTGRGLPASLCSSSHGAGRALSRAEANQSIGAKQMQREMRGVWFDVRRADRLRDEAPSAYKDIRAVMRAQRDLTRIVRELRPVLSYKG